MSAAELVGLRYARANVLFGPRGGTAALYRLGTTGYPLLSVSEKQALARRLERLAHLVGADFSLYRVQRAYPADRYAGELERAVDRRGQDPAAWRAFLDAHADRLAELACHLPEVYLAVSIAAEDATARPGAQLLGGLDRARARVRLSRRGGGPIAGRSLHAVAVAEQRLFHRLGGAVPVRRAHTSELEWLLRRAPLRGLREPTVDTWWQPDALTITTPDEEDGEAAVQYEPLESDVWRLLAEPLTEEPDQAPGLRVEHESGEVFHALLTVASLPEEAVFPGPAAELLHAPLDTLGFPVDAVLHARWIDNRQALAQVRRRVVDVEQVYHDQLASRTGPGWQAQDDRVLAREYEQTLQSGSRPPMLQATITLAVSAESREERERRVIAVREQYGDVQLQRPRGLQEQLYFDTLPRTDGGRVPDYRQHVTAEQFAAMVPTAANKAGDPRGAYVGYTTLGGRRPVRYDITAPSREARASAVLFAGTLGSGKTVAAQLVAYGAERRGSQIVDFDPKPDHGLHGAPGLDGRVQVLELTGAPEQAGSLDPLLIAPAELREDLAASYLLDLLRDPPASWEHAIQRAVRDVTRAGQGGCLAVIERLRAQDTQAGTDVADALEVTSDFGLARLGFGSKASEPLAAAAPVTTIRTPGLTLPDPAATRDTYTRSERVSIATLSLVAALSLRLVSGDRSRHKVIVLDEAWALLGTSQGRALFNRLVRMARAHNATVLLITQRLDDVGELADLIGTWFLFGQDSDTAAEHGLQLIGVQPTPARIARLRDAHAGRCLIRDLHGRTAEMQFDPVDPALLDAFDTTPPQHAEQEVPA